MTCWAIQVVQEFVLEQTLQLVPHDGQVCGVVAVLIHFPLLVSQKEQAPDPPPTGTCDGSHVVQDRSSEHTLQLVPQFSHVFGVTNVLMNFLLFMSQKAQFPVPGIGT